MNNLGKIKFDSLVLGISWSNASAKDLFNEISNNLSQYSILDFTILSKDEEATVKKKSQSPNLVAVVLVLEREAISIEKFRQWLQWCIEQVFYYEDFRLFVFLHDVNNDILKQMADSDSLIATLLDTVQISENHDCQYISSSIIKYIKALDIIRENISYQRWNHSIKIVTGKASDFIIQLSHLIVFILGIWVLIKGSETISWSKLVYFGVVTISGIVLSTLTMVTLFFFLRLNIWHLLFGAPKLQRQFYWSFIFITFTLYLLNYIKAPLNWTTFGFVLGILLDYTRRSSLQSYKYKAKINPDNIAPPDQELSSLLNKVASGQPPDSQKCFVFEEQTAHIFISYTRSSNWACQNATKLYQELMASKIACFLDRDVLEEGSNWRAQLNHYIKISNVFISLVDSSSIQRRWPAAELEMALECRRINALPEIILLIEPTTQIDPQTFSVFRTILLGSRFNISEYKPRIIELNNQTIPIIVSSLETNHFRSTAVFPKTLTSILGIVLLPITMILGLLSILGYFAGIFLGIFTLGEWFWDWKLVKELPFMSAPILTINFSLLLGYMLRYILAIRYEFNFTIKIFDFETKSKLLGFIGLVLFFLRILKIDNFLVLGWTLIAFGFGWILCNHGLQSSFLGNKNQFRRIPKL